MSDKTPVFRCIRWAYETGQRQDIVDAATAELADKESTIATQAARIKALEGTGKALDLAVHEMWRGYDAVHPERDRYTALKEALAAHEKLLEEE